jgi:hypothetical protein
MPFRNVLGQLLVDEVLLYDPVPDPAAQGCSVVASHNTRKVCSSHPSSCSQRQLSPLLCCSTKPTKSNSQPGQRPHLCTRILPILMPLQQARSAFSMDSPLRMMDTPQRRLAKSTPTYCRPVGVTTVRSRNGRCPRPASTTWPSARAPGISSIRSSAREISSKRVRYTGRSQAQSCARASQAVRREPLQHASLAL